MSGDFQPSFLWFSYTQKWYGYLFPKIVLLPLQIFFTHHNSFQSCNSPYWFLYIFHDETFNKASQEFIRCSALSSVILPADKVLITNTDTVPVLSWAWGKQFEYSFSDIRICRIFISASLNFYSPTNGLNCNSIFLCEVSVKNSFFW